MTISLREHIELTCPHCQGSFASDLWLIVDSQEQPTLVEDLRSEHLNRVRCPHCGKASLPPTPLLVHDSAAQRVWFAPPPGLDELTWREQARELHAVLVGSIPLDERKVYLSDVQIAQDVGGLAHMLRKAGRRDKPAHPVGKPISSVLPHLSEPHPAASPAPTPPPAPADEPASTPQTEAQTEARMLQAIQALLEAPHAEAMAAVLEQYPLLHTPAASIALEELADVAVEQREHSTAEALHRARLWLDSVRMGTGATLPPASVAPTEPPPTGSEPAAVTVPPEELPPAVYQALLDVQSTAELTSLVQQQTILLAPWVDTLLARTINEVLDEGNERLARTLADRRELLAELRQQMPANATAPDAANAAAEPAVPAVPIDIAPPPPETDGLAAAAGTTEPMQEAIEALLTAGDDEEAMAVALLTYPDLLTDAAQDALWQLAAEARAHQDEALAAYAVECRAMLQNVRRGLEP